MKKKTNLFQFYFFDRSGRKGDGRVKEMRERRGKEGKGGIKDVHTWPPSHHDLVVSRYSVVKWKNELKQKMKENKNKNIFEIKNLMNPYLEYYTHLLSFNSFGSGECIWIVQIRHTKYYYIKKKLFKKKLELEGKKVEMEIG